MRHSFLLLLLAAPLALADEGMWPYHNFPIDAVKQKHGASINREWLDQVRMSTVRLQSCTGSFVAPNGLILTNHHCVSACIDEHSSASSNLLENGFLARQRGEELRCGTQIADVLVAMEDVTARVSAVTRGLTDKAANDARKKALTELEQSCEQASRKDPRKCQAVTLYEGGQYWLYKYKRASDVRLVFAPERDIAAFGGDPDNFQFPRWCLDMAFLRAYDAKGQPLATPHHLKIDFSGPEAGETVFVSGHPGSTDRLLTVAQLQALRATDLPQYLLRGSELRGRYIQYGKTSAEAERIVQDPLASLENGIKVRRKLLDTLLDDDVMNHKVKEETMLREQFAASGAQGSDPWQEIEAAQATEGALYLPYTFLEAGAGFNSRLFRYARTLVRAGEERVKSNTERLPEFSETALPRLEQQLSAKVPVYAQLEKLTLSFSLERMREWLGPDHPIVRELLAKESPDEVAKRVVDGSKLDDPESRMQLWRGGRNAVQASDDPMIRLARSVDDAARALRKRYEDEVEARVKSASEKIAQARFTQLGTRVAPDATFTLRLNYGTVQGWSEHGQAVEPFTPLSRLFERNTGSAPFRVPDTWIKAREQLNMSTPFNLATNNDIVGGNSGSPLVDAQARVVGLIFDGNIHSISGSYWFDEKKNRAIAVHPAIMQEALSKVYGASALLAELGAK